MHNKKTASFRHLEFIGTTLGPPFTAYLQGGITYESGKLGIISAFSRMEK